MGLVQQVAVAGALHVQFTRSHHVMPPLTKPLHGSLVHVLIGKQSHLFPCQVNFFGADELSRVPGTRLHVSMSKSG